MVNTKQLNGLLAGFKEPIQKGKKKDGTTWERRKYSFMLGEKNISFISWKNFDHLIGKQVTVSFTEEQKQKDGSPYIQKTVTNIVEMDDDVSLEHPYAEDTIDGQSIEVKDGEDVYALKMQNEIVEQDNELSEFKSGNSKEVLQATVFNQKQLINFKELCFIKAADFVCHNAKTKTLEDETIVDITFVLADKFYQKSKELNWINKL